MTSLFSAELELARAAVLSASRLCLAVAASGPGRMEKERREPVTIADFGSQAVVLRTLGAGFPGDLVRAEEGSADLLAAGDAAVSDVTEAVAAAVDAPVTSAEVLSWIDHRGSSGGRMWAIDPIDGTKGFLRGDQFAVAVGLVENGVPVLGVLGCPRLELSGMQGVLVWGGPGIGAFVQSMSGGRPRSISVSGVSDALRARMLGSVESAHGDPELLRKVVDEVGIRGGWVRIDSQAKYAAVAAGIADIYLRPRNRPDWRERVWDHAAGAAIVAGAGGMISDLDGRALDFTTGDVLEHNRGVLVSNGGMHASVLAALAEVG